MALRVSASAHEEAIMVWATMPTALEEAQGPPNLII